MQTNLHYWVFLAAVAFGGLLVILIRYWISGRSVRKAPRERIIVQKESIVPSEPVHISSVPLNLPVDPVVYNGSSIITTNFLKKIFESKGKKGVVEAVKGISFSVSRGEVFGLLGPNGAGKTTTMRMLCTLLMPTSGDAVIAGYSLSNPEEIRKRIGYVSQAGGMQRDTTGREGLMLQAKLYGMTTEEAIARTNELLQLLNIADFADRKTVTYSGGQRRIFDLACGIVHRPEILFLDEPSTGLDPQNRAHVWEQVKKLQMQGTTIIVTTHYLDEADALCDRVAIVDKGVIVAIGTPEELKRQIGGDAITLGFSSPDVLSRAAALFERHTLVRESVSRDDKLHLYVEKGDEYLPLILGVLQREGIAPKTITLSRPSLDDVFLKITGRSFEESEI